MATRLAEVSEEERRHVLRGAIEVLTANLQLPKNEAVEKTTARAAEGIRQALGDNAEVQETLGRVDYVAEQFKTNGEQQRKQAFLLPANELEVGRAFHQVTAPPPYIFIRLKIHSGIFLTTHMIQRQYQGV